MRKGALHSRHGPPPALTPHRAIAPHSLGGHACSHVTVHKAHRRQGHKDTHRACERLPSAIPGMATASIVAGTGQLPRGTHRAATPAGAQKASRCAELQEHAHCKVAARCLSCCCAQAIWVRTLVAARTCSSIHSIWIWTGHQRVQVGMMTRNPRSGRTPEPANRGDVTCSQGATPSCAPHASGATSLLSLLCASMQTRTLRPSKCPHETRCPRKAQGAWAPLMVIKTRKGCAATDTANKCSN